jgi:hypothetical protein
MESHTDISRVIIGGIDSYKFVPVDGVLVWPAVNDLEINEASITLKPGYSWQNGIADYNTLVFVENEEYTKNGPVFTTELKGFLPDDLLANMRSLVKSFNKKYIVIFKTHQGTSRVFGSVEDPCLFYFSATTAALGGRKGTNFSFKKKTGSLAPYSS